MEKIRLKIAVMILFGLLIGLLSCNSSLSGNKNKLIIFHAGSLSVPMKQIVQAFNKKHQEIKVLTEAAGSRDCARKITDLKKECDIMASADYSVIDQLLIPDYADWNIKFSSNEMVIVFNDKSVFSETIDSTNWFEILTKKEVKYGRSDPNSDPCGYRTVLVAKLAEKYYEIPNLANTVLSKDKNYIRPKETDLLALLEINTLDYVFIYRSVAIQHQLKYISLPDKINLEVPGFINFYNSVSVDISGKSPGETITKIGEPMIYGITIPKNAPNNENAIKFVDFILSDEGMKIMEKNGQPSLIPLKSDSFKNIPESLKKYALN
ncbi:MAG: tungstate ABC transporter substrate-binding protein WtpA [Bacteroidetes bacterium]|nr:tungstate ABC transporter substrate-binding protein WtpA [Bacteroidota bacterium]